MISVFHGKAGRENSQEHTKRVVWRADPPIRIGLNTAVYQHEAVATKPGRGYEHGPRRSSCDLATVWYIDHAAACTTVARHPGAHNFHHGWVRRRRAESL